MAVILKDLIKSLHQDELELISGTEGTEEIVTWVQMVESPEAAKFIQSGEIVITTGAALQSTMEKDVDAYLLDMILILIEHRAAGIIINIGPFISKIPNSVIEFCDQKKFPLFQAPWKIHMSELMQVCYAEISRDERQKIEIETALRNAIRFPEQENLYMVALDQNGFAADWSYCVILIANVKSVLPPHETLDQFTLKMSVFLAHRAKDFSVFSNNDSLVAVLGNHNRNEVSSFIELCNQYLQSHVTDERIIMGVGKITKSARCIYKSYRQAVSVCKLQTLQKISSDHIYYEDMGIYKLLMSIDDSEVLDDYFAHTIQPLVDFDQNNETNLVEVLREYLRNDGSVQQTADSLYIHRNTVNYRLSKIRELTNINVSTTEGRLQLMTGLMLMDIR